MRERTRLPMPARWAGAAAVVAALAGVRAAPAEAQEWIELQTTRQADGVSALEVGIEYAVGELRIEPGQPELLYRARLRYDAERFRPIRSWEGSGGTGILRLGVDGGGEVDIDWQHLGEFDEGELGTLRLELGRTVPLRLQVKAGAALSRLELGGLPLADLSYRTGASETEIRFDTPNPRRLSRIHLEAGAARFEVVGLGNARFDRLEFDGGVGETILDFSGDWRGEAVADVSMAFGSLTLRLPRELGLRIEKSGFLAGFDDSGFERVDGGYQTAAWETADTRLRMELHTTVGTVDVDWLP